MSEDERAIRNLIATWMTATQAGDLEKVLDLMADVKEDGRRLVGGCGPCCSCCDH